MELETLDALEDVGQLRAIVVGLCDTIDAQRSRISRLEAVIEELAREVSRNCIEREQYERVASGLVELARHVANPATQSEAGNAPSQHPGAVGSVAKDLDSLLCAGDLSQAMLDIIHARQRLADVSGNYRIFRESRTRLAREAMELDCACEAMRAELQSAPDIYRPSQFWETFFNYNMRQLRDAGLSNFKLTANQNYQNYIPRTAQDPKLKPILRAFRKKASLRSLLSYIENPDGVASSGYLSLPGVQIFRDDPKQLALYRTLVALGWDYCRANDPLGLCPLLEEPELGNPIRVHYAGKLISQDLATSVVEATKFCGHWRDRFGSTPFSVLEVGGGYGRLAHALLTTQNVSQYFIVDIPPALHVSRWYLGQLFPEKAMFHFPPSADVSSCTAEMSRADVIFLLPHQIEHIADRAIDISVAVSSLHEMRHCQANHVLRQMGRLTRHFIYSKNYWSYTNPYDEIILKHSDYIVPPGFMSVDLMSDPLNPAFFIETLERVA